jgi:Protein of unknown function (DUF3102)
MTKDLGDPIPGIDVPRRKKKISEREVGAVDLVEGGGGVYAGRDPEWDALCEAVSQRHAPAGDDLAEIANRIRARIRRTTTDIIDTGNDLLLVKARLEHGEFLKWIETEFGMTDRTARNYMQAAEWAADKTETVSVLQPSILYKLASPSTPEKIRAEALADLGAGKIVDAHALDMKIRQEHWREREAKHKADIAERRRQRKLADSPKAKRQAAKERRAAEIAAEREKQMEAAAIETMTIFEKLAPADLQRLRELLDEFGPWIVTKRLRAA